VLDLADYLCAQAHARAQECLGLVELPVIHFEPDQSHCPVCGRVLQVYKTTEIRRVVSLAHGEFRAIEVVRHCRHHGRSKVRSSHSAPDSEPKGLAEARVTYRSRELPGVVGPKRTYGFDLIFHVGWGYFVECRNGGEIATELAARVRPAPVASRSLHRLLDEFVWLVATVHETSTDALGELFHDNGGYVLCLDGTCEEGSPVHLLCQDAITGIVLAGFTIGSENETEAKQCLQRVQKRLGDPVATMGDMSRPLRRARQGVWPRAHHFTCHYHFVQDVGKDLLKPYHDELSARFRTSKLTPALIEMRRYLGKRIRAHVDTVPLDLDDFLRQIKRGDHEAIAQAARDRVQEALTCEGRGGRCPGLEQLDREELSQVILWIQA